MFSTQISHCRTSKRFSFKKKYKKCFKENPQNKKEGKRTGLILKSKTVLKILV